MKMLSKFKRVVNLYLALYTMISINTIILIFVKNNEEDPDCNNEFFKDPYYDWNGVLYFIGDVIRTHLAIFNVLGIQWKNKDGRARSSASSI